MNNILIEIKTFLRSKANIFSVILISILLVMIIVIDSYKTTINNHVENLFLSDYYFRMLEVKKNNTDEEKKKELLNIPHIISTFPLYIGQTSNALTSKEFTNDIFSEGYIETDTITKSGIQNIVRGTTFPNDEGDYIVCPVNFYPIQILANLKDYRKKDKFNLENYLNKKIMFNYPTFENDYSGSSGTATIELELVGLYENSQYSADENVCFVTPSVSKKILSKQFSFKEIGYDSYLIIVDDYKNVGDVQKELVKLQYAVYPMAMIDYEQIEKADSIYNISMIVIYIIIILFMIIIIIKNKKERDNYYTLLNYLGYKKITIAKIILIDNIINILCSFILALILYIIAKVGLDIFLNYKPYIFGKRDISIRFTSMLLISFISLNISLIFSIITGLNIDKKRKKNI